MARIDEEIKKDIVDSLYWDDRVNASNVTLEVKNGIVRLKGTVSSFQKKEFAADLAGLERGVLFVENHIAVVPTMRIVDQSIAEDIESALELNALNDAEDVIVKVENQKVLLTGELPTWSARRAADQAARFISVHPEMDGHHWCPRKFGRDQGVRKILPQACG